MTLHASSAAFAGAQWLFAIGEGSDLPRVDGLVAVSGFEPAGERPEVVAMIERASAYGARAVFFEAQRHGHSPVAQAFIFDAKSHPDERRFAQLHKRLWSWGGVPLVYRAAPGVIQLFRCAHKPDFAGHDGVPVYNPIETLRISAEIAQLDVWWDAARIRNGAIWDDPGACERMLSATKSAHRKLVAGVRALANQLADSELLNASLRRRLLILSLLIAYLEERLVLLPEDFSRAMPGATRFFEVLANGPALVKLLRTLEDRFNGHVFRLGEKEREALVNSIELSSYARMVQGDEDESGQLSFWRLYSFRDLPVELISNIYQLFVKDAASSIYTPPALVRLMLEEVLSWERIDELMAGDGVILDPACGSGVFLVEAYKRLVLHWRSRNGWARPGVNELRRLLQRVHGVDLEEAAVELAAFSLCLSLCDALEPEEIRASIKLFPRLGGETLHASCFFEAKSRGLINAPVAIVVGNPPFESALSTHSAISAARDYTKAHGKLADKQVAYLFLHEAMKLLRADGVLAMIEPSGFLYNRHSLSFRQAFLSRWNVRELLDFVSVRGLFKKGNADPKIVVVVSEAKAPDPNSRLLHAVFRRNGRATAEQGFDIDYYDLHWIDGAQAAKSRDIWRANLLGGGRVHDFITRLRGYPTLRDYAKKLEWDFGEGYIAGQKGISKPADHIVGKALLPTTALTYRGINTTALDIVPLQAIKDVKSARRFTPPLLLIKEHENLYHGLWNGHYLTYKHEIVGLAAPRAQLAQLQAVERWLERESVVLRAYVAAISPRLFTQRATAILNDDVLSLPYPEDQDLDLSDNERIIASDIVDHQRDFIRLGTSAPIMQTVTPDALDSFDAIFTRQFEGIYDYAPICALPVQGWSGSICKAYAFGKGAVDWSGAAELRGKLDALLREKRGTSLTIMRIVRLYDENFLFLLKPDRHRFWTGSVALRDADDVMADLRAQGH